MLRTLAGLVDLREPADQAARGLTADGLVADDWSACQDAGRRLRATARGMITPSVALPGHASLVLFGGRRASDWSARPALASAVPATVVAIGRPQVGLVRQVRHRANERFQPPLLTVASGQLAEPEGFRPRPRAEALDARGIRVETLERLVRQRPGLGRTPEPGMAWAVLLLASGDEASARQAAGQPRYFSRARAWLR